jgi:CelD/BcsL family acetyltransferase involved in cellulose biosynthesis
MRSAADTNAADGRTDPRGDAGPPLSVVVHEEPAALEEHVPAWEALAAAALEPNVFFEPWLFLPAVRAFGAGVAFRFVLVFARDPARPAGAPLLCGFFPLERRRRYKGLPVPVFGLWRHRHCFLGTPLLRAGYARGVLAALFDWLAADRRGAALLELGHVPGEGPFHQALVDHLHERARAAHVAECFTRALLRTRDSADAYVGAALSGSHRRALKRRQKRLAETGRLGWRVLGPGADVRAWVEEFLRLEAGGWKGRAGTALACQPADRAFFTEVAAAAFRRGRLLTLTLDRDGRPVAARCGFRAGEGSFAFKSAFDEDQAHHSPGVLLELENVRRLHDLPGLRWMDSCTDPDNAMINRLWMERRTIQTVVVATGRRPGDLVVSLLPLLRWLKRTFSGRVSPDSPG